MQALPKSQFLQFAEQAFHLARRAVVRYSSKFSKRRYGFHQHIVLLCLKVRKSTTSRMPLDELIEMLWIQSVIGLEEHPSPSTLCKAFNRLAMAVWRVLLKHSVTLLPTTGVVGIDASGFDRGHASKHYTKRTTLSIRQLKVTLLVDTGANAILDLHVTTTRKHESQIALSLIKRNADEVATLLRDKGYDDQKIRRLAHDEGIRPVVKHREFSSLHETWNARLDANLYGQRSRGETVNSRTKRRYGAFVRSRHWWKQFRELVVGCLTHDIDKAL